jgi:rare lipoprotein A (peptidoglycan hydrolase)/tetratricopeptide (TPR) repeat protein
MGHDAIAKTPGEVHCYNGICHRVKDIAEMRELVGVETEAITSYYDIPERDRFNTGTYTSSGERFDAYSDSHAASSHYPDGTELLLWNPKNGRTSHVRINDFGPFYLRRTLDVTRGVAEKLDFARFGVATLKVIVIWAPAPEDARYRRRRVYPPVEGFLGKFDQDQLKSLTTRLIAQAPARNGQTIEVRAPAAAGTPASVAGIALPANTTSAGSPTKAGIWNTPQITLAATEPNRVLTGRGPIQFAQAVSPTITVTAGSPSAIAAATRNPADVMAREQEIVVAMAALGSDRQATFAPLNDGQATGQIEKLRQLISTPQSLMWQQMLIALGVLSAAAVSWRTRPGYGRLAASPIIGSPGAPVAGPHPTVTLAYSTSTLPLLPQRPAGKSDDDLRKEAAEHIERFAYSEAELCYRQLLAQRERGLGLDHPLTASAERQLADCLREQGRYAAAEPYYRRALSGMIRAAGDNHPAVADILDEYAVCLLRQGHAVEARGLARQSLVIRLSGSYNREHAVTLTILAEAKRAEGNLAEAETDHRNAWSQFVAVSGQDSLDAAAGMMSLGTVMSELGRFQAAEELLNAGAGIVIKTCGGDHPASASAYALLGDLYDRAGALDAAAQMHGYALSIRERQLGPRHPDTVESLLSMAVIASRQYRTGDAASLIERANEGIVVSERDTLGPQSRVRRLRVTLAQSNLTGQLHPAAAE